MYEYINEVPTSAPKSRALGAGSGGGACTETFSWQVVSSESVQDMRAQFGLGIDDLVVVIVVRISQDKGILEISELIRKAAASYSDIKLVFLGRPDGAKAQSERDKLQALDNVVHVGGAADVAPYFALAGMHLFLSHREGFQNVAVEARAMGLPNMAFDLVGVRDSVADGISGVWVPFGDTEAAYRELVRMRSNREATASKYAGARQWVIEHFAKEQVWKRYAKYYAG